MLTTLKIEGLVRVYFNKHADAPLVWSICASPHAPTGPWPTWELEVLAVEFDGCEVRSVYKPRERPDAETGLPSAYFEVFGVVNVRNGIAYITGPET